ncbi:giant [Carabus blaptoides fortunei]
MDILHKSVSPIPNMVRTDTDLQPLDCSSSPVLDLCTRRKEQSPSPFPEDGQPIKCLPDTSKFYPQTHEPTIKSPNQKHHTQMECDYFEEKSVSLKGMTDIISSSGIDSFTVSNKTRPFKAYPKDPFFLAIESNMTDKFMDKESMESYAEFRQKMLSRVRTNNSIPGVTNTKMRRSSLSTSPVNDIGKDASYWEKRRKNNEAAKRSRDARRAKEDEIAIRAAFLEQENLKLKYEITALRNETTKLRCLLYG